MPAAPPLDLGPDAPAHNRHGHAAPDTQGSPAEGWEADRAEVHARDTDIIYVLEGTSTLVTGGTLVGGKTTAPDEIRGDSIEGGTRYPVKAGDSIYVPKGAAHQFQVAAGQHFTATIVKITPKE